MSALGNLHRVEWETFTHILPFTLSLFVSRLFFLSLILDYMIFSITGSAGLLPAYSRGWYSSSCPLRWYKVKGSPLVYMGNLGTKNNSQVLHCNFYKPRKMGHPSRHQTWDCFMLCTKMWHITDLLSFPSCPIYKYLLDILIMSHLSLQSNSSLSFFLLPFWAGHLHICILLSLEVIHSFQPKSSSSVL